MDVLKSLRKKGVAKKIIWFIAVIIIISFGFFGTAYLITGGGGTRYAGRIFGKKITLEDFNKIYRSVNLQAIRQHGYNLSDIAHLLNLEGRTWDRLILLHEVETRRIKISNDQVIQAIEGDDAFKRDGQFDSLLYNAILRNLRVRPRDYEESVRDNLKIAELYRQVTSSVTLAEEEVLREYQDRHEKVQVSYVLVASESSKKDVSVEISEIEQYYQDHKAEFLIPPMVNVQYLAFDFPETAETAEDPKVNKPAEESRGSEEDLEKEKLIKETEETKLEMEKDIIREKADAVFQELLINPNMAEVAGQNNLTVQTSGFFSMEQPNLTMGWSYDLLNKIFQMEPGEVNEPFETSNGLSIAQIWKKEKSYIPEFSEAQDKARAAVINEKAKNIAHKKAQAYLIALKEELDKSKVRDFPKAAKNLQLEIHQTPVFNRGQYLPQIGISKEFQEAAFALTEDNKISDVVATAKGYVILHLDNYIPADEGEYEDAKGELAQSLSDEKREAVFGDYVVQLRFKAGLVDNISQLRGEAQ